MPTDYTAPPEPPLDAPAEIKRLFNRCVEMQTRLEQTPPEEIARQAVFEKIPIPPQPQNPEPLFYKERYIELVEKLRGADKAAEFYYWFEQWCKAEGIKIPENFVSPEAARLLIKEAEISGTDIRNARVVEIWLPYTEPLVRKSRWLRQENARNIKKALKDLGYDSAAIEMVTPPRHWVSAVEFTCEWVARRSLDTNKEYQRETLRNSYARIFPKWHEHAPMNKCSFCAAEGDGEFWVREESIPYCQLHRPDLLPLSEGSAWPDRMGRRWWRQNLDIRCNPPRPSP